MKTFRTIAEESINEEVFVWIDKHKHLYEFLEDVMNETKKLMKYNVVYRGFGNGGFMAGCALVTNDRTGFYGMMDDKAKQLFNKLKIKNPTFGARDIMKAKMYGQTFIMIPKGKFTALQSGEHIDLLAGFEKDKTYSDEDLDNIAKSYSKTLENINDQEIIFDTREYYLLDMHYILKELDKGNRFQKHTGDSIKTYKDLFFALKSFISFAKYKEKAS